MIEFLQANMAPIMFGGLIVFLLLGYSVAFSLAACGLAFGFLGIELGMLPASLMQALPLRIFGIMQWDERKCAPCMTSDGSQVTDDVQSGPEPTIDQVQACQNFRMFSGTDRRCRPSGFGTLFSDCCGLSGWFKDWCTNEELELNKRKQAGTCHRVGIYYLPSAQKMRRALALLREQAPWLEVDGEMHGDVALDGAARAAAMPRSTLVGDANLLVLPNIDAANIAYNLLKTAAGGGIAIGPVLLGAAMPVHVLTASATVRRIVNMSALAIADANAMR